jgi:hypothetical protein
MQQPFPNRQKCPFKCNGCVTAVAAGKSQRLHSGVKIFNWYYLSSPPQILRLPRFGLELELGGLTGSGRYTRTDTCVRWGMAVTHGVCVYMYVHISPPVLTCTTG